MSDLGFELKWEHLKDNVAVVHCTVDNWCMATARCLDMAADNLIDQLEEMGYHLIITVSPNPRFCEYMGGESIGEVEFEGETYEVFQWDLVP